MSRDEHHYFMDVIPEALGLRDMKYGGVSDNRKWDLSICYVGLFVVCEL